MYLAGQGHEHLGPGTSMVQRIGWTQAQEAQILEGFQDGMSRTGLSALGTCPRGLIGGCGLGLFEGGFDPTTWGPLEWAIAAIGGYAVVSVVFTTRRAAGRIAAIPGERRKRKAAYYRAKAAELTKRKAA